MPKLSELRKMLSEEWRKPKTTRNMALIDDLHAQINQQKTKLTNEYKKRQEENHKNEVMATLSFYNKRNATYKKIREEKSKERLEHEKRQQDKIAKKKK